MGNVRKSTKQKSQNCRKGKNKKTPSNATKNRIEQNVMAHNSREQTFRRNKTLFFVVVCVLRPSAVATQSVPGRLLGCVVEFTCMQVLPTWCVSISFSSRSLGRNSSLPSWFRKWRTTWHAEPSVGETMYLLSIINNVHRITFEKDVSGRFPPARSGQVRGLPSRYNSDGQFARPFVCFYTFRKMTMTYQEAGTQVGPDRIN